MDDGALITSNIIIQILNGDEDKNRKAIEVFQEHNEKIDQITSKEISDSTVQRYWKCCNYVK